MANSRLPIPETLKSTITSLGKLRKSVNINSMDQGQRKNLITELLFLHLHTDDWTIRLNIANAVGRLAILNEIESHDYTQEWLNSEFELSSIFLCGAALFDSEARDNFPDSIDNIIADAARYVAFVGLRKGLKEDLYTYLGLRILATFKTGIQCTGNDDIFYPGHNRLNDY